MQAGDKIVYVILAHRLPRQVERLTRLLLAHPESEVLLHWDSDTSLSLNDRVHPLARRRVSWGGFSIPAVFLDGLRRALQLPGTAWVVFLSGQDYPLRSLATVHAELLASPHDLHMDVRRVVEGDPWPMWEPLSRYGYGFRLTPPLPAGVRRYVWRLIERDCAYVQRRSEQSLHSQPWESLPPVVLRNVGAQLALGLRRRQVPFRAPLSLFAGDAWFSVRADAARGILDELNRDPSYVAYMSQTLVPDEAFFHSLICNRLGSLSVGPWRRHRVFLQGESHPHVWGVADLPALLDTGADFARKFDSHVDASILDELDAIVAGA